MQDLQNWISRYLEDCKYQKGLDPKTLKAYRIDLEQFSVLITRNSLELSREGLMGYITDLHRQYKNLYSQAFEQSIEMRNYDHSHSR